LGVVEVVVDTNVLVAGDIDGFMDYLCGRARLVQICFRWRPMLPDPDDDRIPEVAVRAGTPVVAFNVRDFRGAESPGVQTVSPRELPAVVGEPDELYRRAREVAASESIPVDELFASAFEAHFLEFERLKERAARGSYEKFLRVMSKIPAVDPPEPAVDPPEPAVEPPEYDRF
jgi:hypothetical protein